MQSARPAVLARLVPSGWHSVHPAAPRYQPHQRQCAQKPHPPGSTSHQLPHRVRIHQPAHQTCESDP
eukprot:7386417-Prymnesium_polylepis.3